MLGYVSQGTLQPWRGHTVTTGAEVYDESIATSRQRWVGGAATAMRAEIPDSAGYRSAAAFVQDSASLFGDRLALRGGLRGGTCRYVAPADVTLGVRDERVRMSALTFSTGMVSTLTDAINLTGSVNRGFRAANAFDLAAIGVSGGGFEVAPRDGVNLRALVGTNDGATAVSSGVPVSQLGAESMYAFEGGLKLRRRRIAGSLVLFDLELRDAIASRTAIFPPDIVGTSIAGCPLCRGMPMAAPMSAWTRDPSSPASTSSAGAFRASRPTCRCGSAARGWPVPMAPWPMAATATMCIFGGCRR